MPLCFMPFWLSKVFTGTLLLDSEGKPVILNSQSST